MTSRVIKYAGDVSRWRPDARERLEQAAIELFLEQGFAATTVPEITARAGLTTRTFFRHFADKREVIFAGSEIPGQAVRFIAEAPAGSDPMALILEGLRHVTAERFDGRRDEIRVRRDIIRTDDGLQERNLRKRAAVSEATRAGLLARSVDPVTAALLAETCVTLLFVSLDEWLDRDDDLSLFEIIRVNLHSLQAAIALPARPS
jgi:AcrR family transcriptional regulator